MRVFLYSILKACVIRPLLKKGFGEIAWIAAVYRFVIGWLTTAQEKTVSINGYKLNIHRGKGSTGGIAKCLIYDGEYEPHTTEIFKQMIKPNMKVVDVGANIGYYTILASKLVGQGGTVFAFEPEPMNYSHLLENIHLNNSENVVAIKKAASDSNSVAELTISKVEAGAHSLISGMVRDNDGVIDVEAIRLDDAIQGEVDFIKTDTEGNELAVLRGAGRLLKGQDVKLVVEFFPKGFEYEGYTVENLWDLLLGCGFKYMYLLHELEHRTMLVDTSQIQQHIKRYKFSVNVLCLKTPMESSKC